MLIVPLFRRRAVARGLFILFLGISLNISIAHSRDVSDLKIIRMEISADINGKPTALDVLIGKPADTPDGVRLPVALISHGAPGRQGPRSITPDDLSGWVRSLAARGYLAVGVMRSGYGNSQGGAFRDNGTCSEPRPGAYMEHHAAELAAALKVVSRLPEADPSVTIAIGHSAGGAAMFALSARDDLHLDAVISVAGGTYRFDPGSADTLQPGNAFADCLAYGDAMTAALEGSARRSDSPTLWLYAENDPFFGPEIATGWFAAWQEAGGRGQLELLPAYEPNGHRIFLEEDGQEVLLPYLDAFLRENGLPTWDEGRFDTLNAALIPSQREWLQQFLTEGVSTKVIAVPKSGNAESPWITNSSWVTNAYSLAAARLEVLAACAEQSGEECIIIVENFHPTGALPYRKAAADD